MSPLGYVKLACYMPGTIVVPMANNALCDVQHRGSFENWEDWADYLDNLSPYCRWYDQIYDGFFVWGSNTFTELALFTGQVFLVGLFIEVGAFKPKWNAIDVRFVLPRIGVFALLFVFIALTGDRY